MNQDSKTILNNLLGQTPQQVEQVRNHFKTNVFPQLARELNFAKINNISAAFDEYDRRKGNA